jgi:ATP-binding cassette, subfamily B, multidrug efflux pump
MSEKKKPKSYMMVDEQDESVIEQNKIGDYRSFLNLVNYSKAKKGQFFLAFALLLATSILTIISARMMGAMVEQGLAVGVLEASLKFAIFIVVLELSALLVQWTGQRILSRCSSETIYLIRQKLFTHLQLLPLKYYDRQPQGRIVTRITHDVEGIEEFFTSSLGRLVQAMFSASIALVAMLVTDFKLGAILVLVTFPSIIFVALTKDRIRTVNRAMSKNSSALNAKLSEFLSGMEVIRTYGLESWSKERYNESVDRFYHSQLRANLMFAFVQPATAFLVNLPLIALVGFGGHQVLTGAMGIGLFVAFVRYCERFFTPILMLAREVHVIQQAFTNAERVSTFLNEDTEEDIFDQEKVDSPVLVENIKGNLVFDGVWMAYQGEQWVLKNLSFEVKAGQTVGLLGTTGCGKTTTVSLLSRLYDYQKGRILLDGVELKGLDRSTLRSLVGFVSQDVIIFRGSVRENLTTEEICDDVLMQACVKTGLAAVMQKSGLTFDSLIYEGGSNLSIGERQLLALTRVLLRDPKMMILDEATANIDPAYEKIIHKAVSTVLEGRTTLIIAHRLDTIMSCDHLLVFKAGELIEEGSPEGLLSRSSGEFKSLVEASKAIEAAPRSEATTDQVLV